MSTKVKPETDELIVTLDAEALDIEKTRSEVQKLRIEVQELKAWRAKAIFAGLLAVFAPLGSIILFIAGWFGSHAAERIQQSDELYNRAATQLGGNDPSVRLAAVITLDRFATPVKPIGVGAFSERLGPDDALGLVAIVAALRRLPAPAVSRIGDSALEQIGIGGQTLFRSHAAASPTPHAGRTALRQADRRKGAAKRTCSRQFPDGRQTGSDPMPSVSTDDRPRVPSDSTRGSRVFQAGREALLRQLLQAAPVDGVSPSTSKICDD